MREDKFTQKVYSEMKKVETTIETTIKIIEISIQSIFLFIFRKNLYDDPLPSEDSFSEITKNRRKKTRKEVYEENDYKRNNTAVIKFKEFDDEDSFGSQIENQFIQKQEESREKYLDSYDDYDEFEENFNEFKCNKKKRREENNYKKHKSQSYNKYTNNNNGSGYYKQNNWRNNNYTNRKSDMTFNKMVKIICN